MRARGAVLAVIGAQYGSEGKGVIVKHIADRFNVHVRVGGPNAGHSFFYQGRTGGKVWKMRSVPCGWANPKAELVIAAGAVVDMDVLLGELTKVKEEDPDILRRVRIDPKAWLITDDDRQYEMNEGMREKIGSTLEGVGSARVSRIWRNPHRDQRVGDLVNRRHPLWQCLNDTALFLDDIDEDILLEGTQGCGLSLVHGDWPFVTSADTNAAQLAADCGLAPRRITDTLLVARTMPIRVGGNSGPLYDECSWDDLSMKLGKKVEEFTTVTGRLRRIGHWDKDLFYKALTLNRPRWVALTFCDYIDPSLEGLDSTSPIVEEFIEQNIPDMNSYLKYNIPRVPLIGTGGPYFKIHERMAISDWLG